MIKSLMVHWLLCAILLLSMVAGLITAPVTSAAGLDATGPAVSQDNQPVEEKLTLTSDYPVLKEEAGKVFVFTVFLEYEGSQPKVFNLSTETPPGAYADITSAFEAFQPRGIASMRIDPGEGGINAVHVTFYPVVKRTPEPGEYSFRFIAKSEDLSASLELKVIVTAKYALLVLPATGRYNADITAGRDNHISVIINNKSSVAVEDITLYATRPDGWSATFVPERIDSMPADTKQVIDLVVTPPRNTIAGDYEMTVRAETVNNLADMKLRVTVLTPTIWGWIGILIVVVVIAGLAVTFRQLGRR